MNIKHLKELESIDDVKSKYRQLSKLFHPDKGGSVAIMQELNSEYQYIINCFYTYRRDWENELYQLNKFNCQIAPISNIIGVKIQIIDDTVWVTGKTFDIKELLKLLRYRFSKINKAWYFSNIKYYPDNCLIGDLVNIYGTRIIKS